MWVELAEGTELVVNEEEELVEVMIGMEPVEGLELVQVEGVELVKV